MRRRLFVITNPGAGLSLSSLTRDTMRMLKGAGASLTQVQPADVQAARDAARQAAASGAYDAIVAAGGDGTIRHVAVALMDGETPLGIIPGGTGNVLAHEIGLAKKPAAIARMLLEGPAIQVACARANGEPFLLMAGAGFDARVQGALDPRFKGLLGKIAYARPLLGALARPMDALTVTVDQRRYEATWAVISNARHYGGHFVLAPRTGIGHRGLEAILFKARSRAVLLSQLLCLARGQLDRRAAEGRDIEMLACSHVSIAARGPVPVQIDGDVFGTTPLEIEAGSASVRLIVPGAGASGSGIT